MNDTPKENAPKPEKDFAKEVGAKEARKIKARQEGRHNAFFGLGMFGLIGWSVAIPTLAGIAFGVWLDRNYPSRYSWTLTMLVIGVAVGCLNAWFWIKRENERK
jgi:ATP synthase protein I